MSSQLRSLRLLVTLVVAGAIALLVAMLALPGMTMPTEPVKAWELVVFAFLGLVIESHRTAKKSNTMDGSLVFIMHLATGVCFGAWWAAVIAGSVTAAVQIRNRFAPLKISFNVSERILSVGLAFCFHSWLNGTTPPQLLLPGNGLTISAAQATTDLARFLAAALVYFVFNSIAVNAAVAIASGKPVLKSWRANTFWVLGYDLVASLFALLIAFFFIRSKNAEGYAHFGFIATVLSLLAFRHVYGRLNTLQDLYGELDSAYDQLERNVKEFLEGMVRAIEARDPYTSGHSRRVCAMSRAIAIDLGLDARDVGDIENAAMLHDVGKMHAEFAPLLQKEGKLTDEEWAIMKTHSEKSAELVSLFSSFKGYVVSCVRHHHERWDGRGYPDGIKGTDIPLGARIITIADTIDAMTTNRPYRNALPVETVLGELNRGRETQFDPELVELAVNSVTVRRLISDPSTISEQLPPPRAARGTDSNRREFARARTGNDSGK